MNQTNSVASADFILRKLNTPMFRSAAFIICPATLLLLFALATTCQFLVLNDVPASPANDLAKHVAAVLNFKSAFLDGQWLPRLQPQPAERPDFPLFQFYSTLLGYLSLPFLVAGLKPIVAATLAVTLGRWLSASAVYATGQFCGASRAASSRWGRQLRTHPLHHLEFLWPRGASRSDGARCFADPILRLSSAVPSA